MSVLLILPTFAGKFIWEALWLAIGNVRERLCSTKGEKREVSEPPLLVTAPLLFVSFVGYIALGAVLLPQWEDMNFFDGCYFCFISVTTIGE